MICGQWLGASTLIKDRLGIILDRLFPEADLGGVDTKLLSDFIEGLDAPQSLKPDLGLEFGCVDFSAF